jgi:hypothetical protein
MGRCRDIDTCLGLAAAGQQMLRPGPTIFQQHLAQDRLSLAKCTTQSKQGRPRAVIFRNPGFLLLMNSK